LIKKTIGVANLLRFHIYSESEIKKYARKLKFPEEEEKAFWEYHHEKTIKIVRYGMIVLCLINTMNLFTDFYAFPSLKTYAIINRSFTTFMGVLIILITYFYSLRKLIQPMISLTAVTAGLSIMSYTFIGDGIYTHLYHSGVMVVLVGMVILQMNIFLSIASGFFLITAYTLPHLLYGKLDPNTILHNFGNMVAVVFICVIIRYLNEYYMRYIFIQLNVIDADKINAQQRNYDMEKELDLAQKILEQFIPTKSPFPDVYTYYQPMKKIGGDFFTFITFKQSDSTGIFISDVSGHGIPAAFITMMIKSIIDEAGDISRDPAGLLSFINDRLCNHTAGNFVTALYCIYDPLSKTLRYSNAGHYPPLIISGTDIHSLETEKSFPLSIWENEDLVKYGKIFQNKTYTLNSGCRLLLYTDGIIEARNENDPEIFFGYQGLIGSIKKHHDLSCGDFISRLIESLTNFRGEGQFEDDVCLICMDITIAD
jgi:hypothetical protein